MNINLPKSAIDAVDKVKSLGGKVWLVGGAIRDHIRGLEPKDFDFATDLTPEQLVPIGNVVGKSFNVCLINNYEFATLRSEHYGKKRNSSGDRLEQVAVASSIEEDLARRDFTCNAIAYDLETNQIIDPYNGIEDIKNVIVRFVGDPYERIDEDPIRMLRAVRFSTDFNWEMENTDQIEDCVAKIRFVASERIYAEFKKVHNIGEFLDNAWGLMVSLIPELYFCEGVKQPPPHELTVSVHLGESAGWYDSNDFTLAFAAFLHDIGKPLTFTKDLNDKIHFYDHQFVGAEMVEEILTRLSFPNSEKDEIVYLVKNHMEPFHLDPNNKRQMRRFVSRHGEDLARKLINLNRADELAKKLHSEVFKEGHYNIYFEDVTLNAMVLEEAIHQIIAEQTALGLKDLAIDGTTLIEMGYMPGPKFKEVLNACLEAVLENPENNTVEYLLDIAKPILNDSLFKEIGGVVIDKGICG